MGRRSHGRRRGWVHFQYLSLPYSSADVPWSRSCPKNSPARSEPGLWKKAFGVLISRISPPSIKTTRSARRTSFSDFLPYLLQVIGAPCPSYKISHQRTTNNTLLVGSSVFADGNGQVQYDPKTGKPYTVSYHLVNAMLLNEVQKQHRDILALKEQNKELSALKEQVKELSALKEQNEQLSARLSRMESQLSRTASGTEPEVLPDGRLSKLEARLNQ